MSPQNTFVSALIALSTCAGPAAAVECGGRVVEATYNGLRPFVAGGAVGFVKRQLKVDADGAPNAYQIDGKGLSYTCDGVAAIVNGRPLTTKEPGWEEACRKAWNAARATGDYSNVRIFGFATDKKNRPLVQQAGDKLPGLGFISATSVTLPDAPTRGQSKYVDATEISYIVLSKNFQRDFGVKPSDLAVVYRRNLRRVAFAIFADSGGLGEGSVRLHQELGSNPILVRKGVRRAKRNIENENVLTLVFPGRAPPRTVNVVRWRNLVQRQGQIELANWGGLERLHSCSK